MSIRIADKDTVQLRFPIGTRVECNCGAWKAGTIVRHFYTQSTFGEDKCVPYQVQLDEGRLIFAPKDEDEVVRLLIAEPKTGGGGRRPSRRRKEKKAPVLAHGANEPSRFQLGDRVEVKISCNSEPGSPQGVEMISVHSIAGGRWVPAKVTKLRYAQEDWCPGFYCAYAVQVHGDATPDGVQYETPVREDDERCIRSAPPLAPPPPPPRFSVGTRVECNGGPNGWKAGVVREIWPEAPSGVLMPYCVELDGGGTVLIPHDEDLGIRALHVVEWSAEYKAWDDTQGVEAVYNLLAAGALRDKKGLPKVGLCGDAHAVDALTDAVASVSSEASRVALMLEQILSTAEKGTPPHPLVGVRVKVHGLSGNAELNGQRGTAVSFSAERARYEVRLDKGGGTTFGVRDANLSPAEEPMVTCPICLDARLTDPLGPARNGPGAGTATVTLCCGKVICNPCHEKYMLNGINRTTQTFPLCPFCREPTGYMDKHADDRLERELLKRRATQGDPVAMYNLSGSFDKGRHGLPIDYQASLAWAALAAMVGGHVRAMNNVGYALKDGEGMPADAQRAAAWFQRGAELDHVSCIWALGKAYAAGHGVARDLAAAKRWLKRGKEMGDSQSAIDLSRLPAPHGEELGNGSCAGFGGMPLEFVKMMMAGRQ